MFIDWEKAGKSSLKFIFIVTQQISTIPNIIITVCLSSIFAHLCLQYVCSLEVVNRSVIGLSTSIYRTQATLLRCHIDNNITDKQIRRASSSLPCPELFFANVFSHGVIRWITNITCKFPGIRERLRANGKRYTTKEWISFNLFIPCTPHVSNRELPMIICIAWLVLSITLFVSKAERYCLQDDNLV